MVAQPLQLEESPWRPTPPTAAPSAPPPGATPAPRTPSAASDPSALSDPSPAPLPSLSSQNRPLLARLFALGESYTALAAELATEQWNHLGEGRPKDLLDLYQWSTRPDIAPWIAFHRSMTDLQRRTLALSALESVIKSTESAPERRRAATTLLSQSRRGDRALDHRWPHECHGSAGSVPARRGAPRQYARPLQIQNPQSKIQNLRPAPPPSIIPDPAHTPEALAAAIATDLQAPFSGALHSTVHAVHAPGAPIAANGLLQAHVEKVPFSSESTTSDAALFTPPAPFTEGQALAITDPRTSATVTLHFVRRPDHSWLLWDLNSG